MRIHLAGGLRIEAAGGDFAEQRFPGRLGRLAFAYLAAEHERPVPRAELAEILWAGAPPASWEKGTTVLMSKLRTILREVDPDGRDMLSNAYGCYQLCLPPSTWIDVVAAGELVAGAETALVAGSPETAAEKASAAARVARAEFLPGEDGDWVRARRDDQRRLLVRSLDCVAAAHLALANPRPAIAAAAETVTLEPYRESGYVLLMRAHVAAGDRAEALRVHEQCRALLSEELGVDPSPATEAAYLDILRLRLADPPASPTDGTGGRAADDPAPPTDVVSAAPRLIRRARPRQSWRRIVLPACAGAAVVVAGGVTAAVAVRGHGAGGTPTPVVPQADSVARIGPGGDVFTVDASVGERPTGVAVSGQRVWVINYVSQTLSWLDSATGTVVGTRAVGGTPTGIAAGAGAIWVTAQFGLTNGTHGSLLRFDPTTGAPSPPMTLGDGVDAIVYGAEALWVTNDVEDTVVRVDPVTLGVGQPIHVGRQPRAIAVGGASVWVANTLDGTVSRIDAPTSMVTATVAVAQPTALAADRDSLWVVSSARGSLTRVDTTTDGLVTTLQVGAAPGGVCIDGGSAWVSVGGTDDVVRIDGTTNRQVATLAVRGRPDAIASGDGAVWVAVAAS